MPVPSLDELLNLPTAERAILALALWESLDDSARAAHFDLTPDQRAELDRRWQAHTQSPSTAIPWDDLKTRLRPGK
jgi:putative addiction module component (TIGR02574 family)